MRWWAQSWLCATWLPPIRKNTKNKFSGYLCKYTQQSTIIGTEQHNVVKVG